MANIKVAVRVRPISTRESKNSESSVVVYTEQNRISLTNLKVPRNKAGDSRERTRKYGFDYCFDSSDPRSENYADQAKIYEILGRSPLDHLFTGYNSCLLAYGQSASGKTYTMMGTEEEPGLTPRLCQGIFARIDEEKRKENIFRVSVSYLEIYNERVRDLLEPSSSNHRSLRVREHPRLGPYVQGLTRRVACTLERLMSYIEGGTRARKTGSTLQNANSSRSHTLLTIFLSPESAKTVRPVEGEGTGKKYDEVASTCSRHNLDVVPHYGGKLHLVDLAGSETARNNDGVHRLKEGANINKSLVALGNVISALAGRASTVAGANRRYIPYRDSSLTWLLKDALGGNATTIMLATISPASRNYNETAHTLRFAQRAHSVVNKPVVNEDPMARTIRELRSEIARLKSLLMEKNIESDVKPSRDPTQQESTNYNSENNKVRSGRHDMSTNKRPILDDTITDDGIPSAVRRVNSSENVATRDSDLVNSTVRKFGSYECLDRKLATPRGGYSYNRAEISELEDEEKELIGEINETVFVDIPTLVAVLIKPDNNLDENSTAQIEEICSEELHEYQIESDFVENVELATNRLRCRSKLGNNEYEDEDSQFDSIPSTAVNIIDHRNEATDANDSSSLLDSIGKKEKAKVRKQDSINVTSSANPSTNLYTLSRSFGSAEIIEKKRDRLATLERSNTSLEKQKAALPEETNERYNEDSKNGSYANLWKEAAKSDGIGRLQRTASNESDRTPKDNSSTFVTSKIRNNAARKPSLESLKRKTSKDSSSSSSKDEQILIPGLTSDRIIRRKDSLDHNAFTRTHTPVQRTKRAEIVAAVTERLYSSRKQLEETATSVTGSISASTLSMSSIPASTSGVRSPPEGTDVRPTASPFTTKSKLQEISRKMLAKRRRVNVDTQTEQMQTIRMKDSASLTDEQKIVCQDVGVLTDEHNDDQETKMVSGLSKTESRPVLRVKEIATLTDKLKSNVTQSRDAECLVNDLNFYEYGVHALCNDPQELFENAQRYTVDKTSNTDFLESRLSNGEKVDYCDKSTNTVTTLSVERNSNLHMQPRSSMVEERVTPYFGERCNAMQDPKGPNSSLDKPERNVISVSLPDSVNITIETTNLLESRVVLIDDTMDDTKTSSDKGDKLDVKNSECQTEKQDVERKENCGDYWVRGFATKSSVNQTDNKCFRIENIFQDPRNVSRIRAEEVLKTSHGKGALKASVTFTNSLGTCFVPETRECATGTDKGRVSGSGEEFSPGEDSGAFTRSRIQSERSSGRGKNIGDTLRPVDVWKNWIISFPPASWQRPRNLLSSVNVEPWTFVWSNSLTPLNKECTAIVTSANLKTSREESSSNSSSLFLSNDLYDKNRVSDLKSPSLIAKLNPKRIVEQDYNFSDDSLDYNEENVLSCNKNVETSQEREEGFENICQPDVVAHTKRDSSILVENTCDNGVDSSPTCLFDNNHMEFSKGKPSEPRVLTSTLGPNCKSLILKQRSVNVDNDHSREARTDIQERQLNPLNDACQKRVTFLDGENFEERGERSRRSGVASPLNRNRNSFSKAIVKGKTHESDTNDDSWILGADCTEDRFGSANKTPINFLEDENKSKVMNSLKISNDTTTESFQEADSFENGRSDSDSYDDVDIDRDLIENCGSMKLKRKVLEEYLNEATTFMRNMNSLNEYVSNNANVCPKHQKQQREEGNRRRAKNYEELENDLKLSDASDDNLIDEPSKENDPIPPTESFQKCLQVLERLENCIRKTNEHDRYLREKYGIVVESTAAKSGLASSSIDSGTNAKMFHNFIQKDRFVSSRKEFPVRSEAPDCFSKEIFPPFKDFSVTRVNGENDYAGDDCYGRNNKVLGLRGELERRNSHRVTNVPSFCHCCCMKNTNIKGCSCRERACYDTRKLYRLNDDDRNSNDFLDDSIATINENVQLLANTLIKPTECRESLDNFLEDNVFSRRTMTDAIMRCTKSETSNSMNSRSFHRLAISDTKSYSWRRWKYRPESPRAKFLELLRERRRIVESSRDVRS
ncbi:hypothetical protein KPH14_006644 [Odynerus spinipes]|uniref:Kinesin motor domain-containing protein n=1 Tax=Odynerus spinipes TaxID=1348599 RepID=A0AAD9RQT6_9HYME|nr:hypothetical protein KPH14_006644 [Odynerus spinipes]